MKLKDPSGIAVEAFLLREGHTGVERYILNLIQTLAQIETGPITLFILAGCHFQPTIRNPNLIIKVFPIRNTLVRVVFQHFLFPFWLRSYRKVIFTGYLGSLFFPSARSAISVFDLIALEKPSLVKFKTRWYYQLCLPWFLRKAALLVVPSEKVRKGISQRTKNKSILKLQIPVEESFYRAENEKVDTLSETGNSVLIVGYGEKKKNQHLLRHIAPLFPRCTFFLVGKRVAPEEYPENVVQMGFIPQEDLVRLYRQVDLLAFFSMEEGYGLPIYEALVSGTPVLCWREAPFTEVESPLMHFPAGSNLDDYTLKLGQILSQPKLRVAEAFKMIRWPEYWSKLESELLRMLP
jgi:glycosyltransferase involved in cell wall biosynthesis